MKLVLSYQTQNLPAPYAYAVVADIEIADKLVIDFTLTYLDRQDLSDEEIVGEGFTNEDDFSWKGTLGHVWVELINDLVRHNRDDRPMGDFYLHIADDHAGFPDITDDLIVQELIQAVYEAGGHEAPLSISICEIDRPTTLIWKFEQHKAFLDQEEIAWNMAYELMQLVYTENLERSKPTKIPRTKTISFDGQSWHHMSTPSFWRLLSTIKPS